MMPNRIIRDNLLTSWRYERLSGDGKLFFFHLLLSADDFGCIDLGCTFLRRRVLFSQDSDERIAKLISELSDVDLLRPYSAKQGLFGFLPRFRQRVQAKYLKYPKPPECILADDDHAKALFDRQNFPQKNNENTGNPTDGQPLHNGCTDDAKRTVDGRRKTIDVKTKDKTQRSRRKRRDPFILPEWLFPHKDVWDAYLQARIEKKKPATDWAKHLAVTKLEYLRDEGHNPRLLLAESAFNGWTDFWPKGREVKS